MVGEIPREGITWVSACGIAGQNLLLFWGSAAFALRAKRWWSVPASLKPDIIRQKSEAVDQHFKSHGFLRPALISEHISTASQTESNKQNCKEIYFIRASQVAQCIKNLSAMLETWGMCVLSVGHEDPLEEALATHSSTLAWRIPKRAWWTTVHRVAKSQTRLKQLSKHMCFIT